jgi:cell fate regulator YaaT (PSP1 superfamily)
MFALERRFPRPLPMPILPLPQFEADLEADRKVYEALKAPKSIVVRFGVLKMVGEFPYDGEAKPGCGSKLIVRTHRGTEMAEMLTSTCPNAGCSKSVTRKQMLEYIQNSGGRDYPFFPTRDGVGHEGRVLRVATPEDMDAQARLEQSRHALRMEARQAAQEVRLPAKVVDVEPLLGGERITVYFNSEERVDVREIARILGQRWNIRVEMRQIGARDEARITADYERCGQYCCCKNFLKVLKPVSMRSAKIQKATLDPLKISGRCGRLMCCLRYEDATYEDLRKRLPRRKQRVGTAEGDGFVVDTQILTQLALIQLDADGKQVAIPVEELTEPSSAAPPPPPEIVERPAPQRRPPRDARRPQAGPPPGPPPRRVKLDLPTPQPPKEAFDDEEIETDDGLSDGPEPPVQEPDGQAQQGEGGGRRRRRRRRRGRRPGGGNPPEGGGPPPAQG